MRIDFLERRSRRAVIALILLAVLAAVVGMLRWPIPAGWSEARLQKALTRTTGYRVEKLGQTHFSALPWPTIHVSDLVLVRANEPAERVDAGLVKARLNAFSWLTGEPRLVELSLIEPRIDLLPDADAAVGQTGDTALSAAIIDLLGRDRRRELRQLRIERGTLRLGGQPWMTNLSLKLTGGVGADLRLSASGLHLGQPLLVQAEVAPVGARERRPVRATIAAPAFTAGFTGVLYGARSLDGEGQLAVAIIDGSAIARRLALTEAHAPLLDGLSASGNARFAWPAIQIRDARVERGQTRLDGSIEASFQGGRVGLAATLDAPRFDLTSALAPLAAAMADRNGGWSAEPLARDWLNAGTLDLRLSTGQLAIGATTIENAAVSLQLGGGRMDLMLSDGRLRGGTVKGRLSLADLPDARLELRLQGSCDRLDIGPIAGLAGLQRARGLASGQASLKATGATVAALVASAEGRMEAAVRDGEVPGFDLDRLATRAESASGADRRTRFSSLSLQMQVGDGKVRITDGAIASVAARAAIEGSIGLASRTFDVTLRPAPTAASPRPSEARVKLEGPWSGPVFGN
jgi:uncharacterized protein involved in outer membrane biogenesis